MSESFPMEEVRGLSSTDSSGKYGNSDMNVFISSVHPFLHDEPRNFTACFRSRGHLPCPLCLIAIYFQIFEGHPQ